jgi:hypothetical protein
MQICQLQNNSRCCCNCGNHLPLFQTNPVQLIGWACVVSGNKPRVYYFHADRGDHGVCEAWITENEGSFKRLTGSEND